MLNSNRRRRTATRNQNGGNVPLSGANNIPQDLRDRVDATMEEFNKPNYVQNGRLIDPSTGQPAFGSSDSSPQGETRSEPPPRAVTTAPTVDPSVTKVTTGATGPDGQVVFEGVNGVTRNDPTLLADGVIAKAPIQAGMHKALGPDGKMVLTSSPEEAQRLNNTEMATQKEDLAAQQRFLSSPEAEEMTRRQGSATWQAGDYLRASNKRQADINFGREQPNREQSQPGSFNATTPGSSPRDAFGLTQGDRRNILRSQGVGGSAQIAQAKVMGAQNNQASDANLLQEQRYNQEQALEQTRYDQAQARFDQKIALEQTRFDQGQASTEQTSQAMASALRADLEANPDDAVLQEAFGLAQSGNLDGAEQLLEMRPNEADSLEQTQTSQTSQAMAVALRDDLAANPDDAVLQQAFGLAQSGNLAGAEQLLEMRKEQTDTPELKFQTDPATGQRIVTYGNSMQQITAGGPELTSMEKELDAMDRAREAGGRAPLSPEQKQGFMEAVMERRANGSTTEDAMAMVVAQMRGIQMPEQNVGFSFSGSDQQQAAPKPDAAKAKADVVERLGL